MSGGKNAAALLIASSLFWSVAACAAEYTLDFTSGVAHDAEAPVLRRAEMPAVVGTVPAVAVGDTLNLRLFGDVDYALRIVSAPPAGIAGQSFIAKDANGSASAIVKVSEKAARISVDDFMNRRQYTVRCKDGKVLIVERDNSQMDDGECGTCGGDIEAPQPAVEETKTTSTKKSRTLLGASGNEFPLAEQKSVVDILVAFDQGAKAWALRDESEWDSLEDCADAAIQRMNDVLVNTKVDDKFLFRLVGTTEVDGEYNNITDAMLTDLRKGAAPFEKIPALRDYYGADTVTLLVNVDENQNSYTTGIANGLYGVDSASMSSYALNQYGYNVCHIQRTFREHTMAHETGHCMGCGHSNRNNGFKAPQSTTYSCGYHFIADTDKKRYRTVMGYNTADGNYYLSWAAAPYFSSPDLTPDEYGISIGTTISNNNRRVLMETCAGVSAYRNHVVPYEWDVRFLDENGNELRNGRIFENSMKVVLSVDSKYSEAKIYLTSDGTTPNTQSLPYNPYSTITVTDTTTLTASIVVDGVAQSVRSVRLVKGSISAFPGSEGLVWETSGDYPWQTVSTTDWTNGTATVLHNYTFGEAYGADKVSYIATEIAGPKRLYFRHKSNFGSQSEGYNIWGRFSVVCEGGETFATSESSMTWRRDYVDIPSGLHRVAVVYSQGNYHYLDSGVWLDDLQLVDNPTEVILSPRDVASFNNTINVTLYTDCDGQTIYYTTDGSTPTAKSSLYTAPIAVSGNATIKAIAVDVDGKTSAVAISNYKTRNKGGVDMSTWLGDSTRIWSGSPQNEWGQSAQTYIFNYNFGTGPLHNSTWLGTLVDGPKLMEFTYKTAFLNGSSFSVTIDGEELMLDASGSSADVTRKVSIPAGTHDVRFVYGQNSSKPVSGTHGLFLKSVSFVDSVPLAWSGEAGQSGDGRWMSDSAVLSWNDSANSFENGLSPSVTFGNLSGNSSSTVTVKGEVVPGTVAFNATTTAYTFDNGDDNASITFPDANFSPSGNVTFNVPVKLEADSFTVAAGKTYAFNAPFGPNATSSSATFSPSTPIVVGAASTLRVAPGNGKTQTFEKFNNTGTYWNTSKFIIGEGTVRFTGDANGGKGLFGSLQLDVENGGNLVFEKGDVTGYNVGNSTLTIRQGGTVTFNTRDSLRRTVNFAGGSILLKGASSRRGLDLMNGLTLNVSADSSLDCDISATTDAKYVYMRDGSPSFKFSNNACLVNNVVYVGNSTSTGGIKLSGEGTYVQNGFGDEALTYSGATEIGGGMTLALNAEHENAGAYTVASGARLTGSGAITGDGVVTLDGSGAKLCGSLAVKNLKCASDSMFGDQWNPVSAVVTGSLSTKSDGAGVTVNNGYLAIGADCDVSGFSTANLNIQDAGLLLSNSLTVASVSVNNSTVTIANGAALSITGSVSLDCSKLRIVLDNPAEDGAIPMLTANGGFANIDKLEMQPAGYKAVFGNSTTQLCYEYDPNYVEYQTRLPIVDVLVAYDNGAVTYMGERSLEEFAQQQIDKMNDILATNKLDTCYSYRLAGVCKVSGTYDNIDTAPAMVSEGDGAAVTLRAMRELYGADTVTLLVNTSGATLGNSSPLTSNTDVAGCHDDAFSVCSIVAVDTGTQHTMIHENAHNMGCGHARAQSEANSPFSYGRGYYFMDGETKRHTIMAYDVDGTDVYAHPSPYFSTSSGEFGFTLGNADNDNARVLRETCRYVAQWRDSVKPYGDETMVTDEFGDKIVSGCVFKDSIKVTVAAPVEGATLYYTLDGSEPTKDNDMAWATQSAVSLNIKADKTLKVAYLKDSVMSPTRTVQFYKLANIPSEGLWQTSNKYPWTTEGDSIRSYNQTNYTYQCTTPLKATIVGPKRLSFKHKSYFGGTTIAGNNYSHFDVLLDDSPVLTQTECTNDWTDAQLAIPEGTHEVTFVFSQRFAMNNNRDYKDGTPEADDAVWIKDIAMEETPIEYVIFSNTNAEPNRASFTVSGDVKISIPAVQSLGLATGALVRLTSLDFGQVTHDDNYGPAARISITDGTTTWTSAIVATNETDRFPKMATNNDVVNRLVYSFAGANCILTVGAQYDLELQDAGGNKISKIRYAFATNGEKIITGMDMTSNGTTYTPMMQLKGEIAALAPIFDWTPGSAPTGWVSSWAGEHHGSTHEIIGPDGLATNQYVVYYDGNGDSQKWIPYQGSPSPEKLTNYTFLAHGNIDAVAPSAGNMGVLWDMGHNGNQKTMLVKDSSGNVRLVQANGNVVNKSINAGPVEGYHLFTVRFSEASGASLQIDNGAVHSDSSFTQVSDRGLQIGSILGGLTSNFERGVGFAVLKMLAFGTDSIPTEQYGRLCEEYPAVTNRVLAAIGETKYYRLAHLVDKLANDLAATASFSVTEETEVNFDTSTIYCGLTGESYNLDELGIAISDGGNGVVNIVIDEENITHECVLRISEIMPKPTDAKTLNGMEGMDVNGLESGWVEVENTSDKWADLADYRFIRVNRGKKTDPAGFGNFPSRLVPPRSRAIFYTSERYSNSKDQTVSAFEHGTFDGKPMVMGTDLHNILVWGDKVNPKKSPYVRLYHAPGGDSDSGTVVDTVVIPSDLPEGWSIIVGDAAEGEGTRRWLCPTPTRGRANTSTDGLKRIGPNVGPLYEKKGQKKTDLANEFAVPTPPATPGEDYVVTLPVNGVMNPDGTFTPRAADKIQSLKFVFRKDLDDSTLVTNDIDITTKNAVENWGDQYTATIPAVYFPAAGHLMQWKVLITDGEGVEWTSPSFNNPDDGYEWYGTIVEPDPATQMSATLPTWHMFASGNHLTQMDVDADKQDRSKVPNQARVAIYDSSTSNYYDYVRVDLRGNTSAGFTKKGHGLRFAKAHPLTMTDVVTGETIEEIRKTSLISEFADPSCMRQMIAFWLWKKMGNLVPFDFSVRCNLNGKFYQLAFNSERFTDELIEDVYGLDKFGYSYKNVGTLKSGSGTTAGGIEKKTPDDENESDITVLQNELRSKIIAAQQVSSSPDGGSDGLDNAALTKFVVQKFNLPAWLNYLASARITQEMDDVWANVCIYYDNPDMKEGSRGTGTWMPLGYDFNLTFGQHYLDGGMGASGLKAQDDWFKCHPFYGGNRVRCYSSSAMTSTINYGNDGFESVLQSAKFRRLYLRRLRTLMDQQLKEPGTAEASTPFMAKMREMADLMRTDAALDLAKWPNNGSDYAIDVWPSNGRPANMDAGIQDIWDNYVVPRREHLYVTHSVTNTAKVIGYGSNLNAGIPKAQSPVEALAPNISISNLTVLDAAEAEALGVAGQLYDTEVVVIRNDNAEVVDMSGWRLAFSVDFTFPAGTVCDANDSIYVVADRRAYVTSHSDELTDQVIVGNATFTGAGPVALYDADGALVYSAIPQTDELKYLRLHSFYGNTLDGDGDAGEWFTLTNISDAVTLDLAGVTVCFLKQGDPEDGTAHCHVTLENKKGKGSIAPLKSWSASQADYSDKGWLKIQNNKQQITIYDKYGSVCQSLKVTQKTFPLAYGNGGYLVCDSADASVTKDSQWHEVLYELPNNGESSEPFAADSQEAANELIANAKPALSDDDVDVGLEPQYLKIVAQPVDGEAGKYKAVVVVNPDTVEVPVMAQIEEGESTVDPLTVESDEEGSKVTVGVSNATVGLWYGFIWTDSIGVNPFENDVESFKRATSTSVKIESKAEAAKSAQKAFFRVKVLPAKPR